MTCQPFIVENLLEKIKAAYWMNLENPFLKNRRLPQSYYFPP